MVLEGPDPLEIWPRSSGANPPPLRNSENRDKGGVTLALSPDKNMRVDQSNIRNMKPMSVSLMPAGMDQVLNHRELADLIAYLEASR